MALCAGLKIDILALCIKPRVLLMDMSQYRKVSINNAPYKIKKK